MSDDAMNFAHYVATERTRLNEEKRAITETIAEWQARLNELDREYAAVAAYEAAKSGKAQAARTKGRRARRGSRREAVLGAVRAADSSGMTRGELISSFGAKGDPSAEMSISNALTALTKNGKLVRSDGRYHLVLSAQDMNMYAAAE